MNKRPISVTIIASVYLLVGTVGFAVHLSPILKRHAFHSDDALVEFTELIAIVCGVFLLQGRNWARWLYARVDGVSRGHELRFTAETGGSFFIPGPDCLFSLPA